MPEVAVFGTHRFVKNLAQNGFTERQAEALAREQVTLLTNHLATKADIESMKAATKADIESMKAATKADIEVVKTDIEALKIATKADIEALKIATKAEIDGLELKMEARIATLKADLLKWGIGALIAQGGLILAILRLL